MKSLARNTVIHMFGLFALPSIFRGFTINGGLEVYLLAGFVLTIMTIFLKPILQIITLPLNLITFGAFSFIINAIILYALTLFVPQIIINTLEFPGLSFLGFVIPKLTFGYFFAYVAASIVFSSIIGAIHWLIEK